MRTHDTTKKPFALTPWAAKSYLIDMRQMMLSCMCAAMLFGGGCGKDNSLPDAKAAGDQAAPASPRGPIPVNEAPAAPVAVEDRGDVNATLQQLTQALRDYVVRTRSVPKNFEEFTAKAKVTFPAPPAGKKYAIQGQAIVLVNQ